MCGNDTQAGRDFLHDAQFLLNHLTPEIEPHRGGSQHSALLSFGSLYYQMYCLFISHVSLLFPHLYPFSPVGPAGFKGSGSRIRRVRTALGASTSLFARLDGLKQDGADWICRSSPMRAPNTGSSFCGENWHDTCRHLGP
uniref:Uncharacterized protein n=1 Tax=Fundulus heteroclitus TaxID=8078 RepID=A0A3Q2PQV3_FUNHE